MSRIDPATRVLELGGAAPVMGHSIAAHAKAAGAGRSVIEGRGPRGLAAILGLSLLVTVCGPAARPTVPTLSPTTAPAPPAAQRATPSATPGRPALSLRYVAGSSAKVEQLIGDTDYETKQPTNSRTLTRYGIRGTDLGNSFEHQGKVYFLFGDTIGRFGGDVIGVSRSTDPAQPLALDFLTDAQGRYLKVEPDGRRMGGFEVPVHGISLGGVMYLTVKQGHSGDHAPTDIATLVRYDEATRTFRSVRELSRLPAGRFIEIVMRPVPDGLRGLPAGGPYTLMFGAAEYRRSNAYLAIVPDHDIATGNGTRYYAGLTAGEPRWSEREGDAVPIVLHPVIGEFSVIHIPLLGLWVMTYNSAEAGGVVLRYAPAPWGPWSDPQIIFNGTRDGAVGKYIYSPAAPGQLAAGPVISGEDPTRVHGGPYAPYPIERFTQLQGDTLTLHFLLSTWNPYTVVRMRTQLRVER